MSTTYTNELSLVIANKNYSSWSMRPWVLLRAMEIPFTEIMLKFHSADWQEKLPQVSPSRMVPVLWDGAVGATDSVCVWESNAIFEYIAERYPNKPVWPEAHTARAHARAIVAEMHAGFRALRMAMPMNIRSQYPGLGMSDDVKKNIARIESLWFEARTHFGDPAKPFLYGDFSAADAMYAPVVMRFATYHPELSAATESYCKAVRAHPAVAAWVAGAMQETEFVEEDEPYATKNQKE
jgi:glutathione S-transferase